MPSRQNQPASALGSSEFPPTRWSVLGRVAADETRVASEALDVLCRAYWYPLYAFLRRSGHSPDDAQDWTQGFFNYLLETGLVTKADPAKGRFRSFLLASLKNFLSSEQRRLAAAKRGGGRAWLSLDEEDAEERYVREPIDLHTPETLFELSWARTLLAQTMVELEKEYAHARKMDWFTHLRPYLQSRPQGGPSYKDTAAALGKTEEAVKSGVQRMRQRFQQLLRAQIALTVPKASDIEAELRHLRQILSA